MCQICGMGGLSYTSTGSSLAGAGDGFIRQSSALPGFGGEIPNWGGSGSNTQISMSATGDVNINGVLSGVRWTTGTLTYSFPTSAGQYEGGYSETGNAFATATEALKVATRYAMNLLSQYTNMVTTEVDPTTNADIRSAFSNSANPTAYAYYPSNGTKGGDVWYGSNYPEYANPIKGQYAWTTVLHEIGHALGLKHGHETGGPSNTSVSSAFDHMSYTLMTYRSYQGGPTTGYTNETNGYAQTFMMYDIAALQAMYGANYNTQSGNTTYTWSATTGEMSINGVGQGAPGGNRIFMTLWDGNGTDTYDFSNYSTNLSINLAPGSFSITNTLLTGQRAHLGSGNYAPGNIFNALLVGGDVRSLIENATGGTGNDTLVGNQADNVLDGGAGGDTLTGAVGNDTFVYRSGADIVTDFVAGGTDDAVDLRSFTSLTSFSSVMALGVQSGSNVVFTFSSGNTLTLNNVTLASLTSSDFILTADNSRTVTTQDTTGQPWDYIVEYFNAAGTRYQQQTYNDNGTRNAYYWDALSAQTWREYSEDYTAAGQRTIQRIYNDNNSYRFFYWDPTNTQNWTNFDDEFNAAGQRHTERIVYDAGNTRNFYWDVTSSQTWTTFDEEFTAGAGATRSVQRIQNDNGTTSQQFWDTNNSQTYSTYVDYMNAAGQRVEQRIFHDQGANAGGYTRVYYDPTDAQTWQQQIDVYNSSGVLTSSTQVPD